MLRQSLFLSNCGAGLERSSLPDRLPGAVDAVINLDRARKWLGRIDVRSDQAAPAPLAALYATLDSEERPPAVGDALPPLAHWLYFRLPERRSEIRKDGRERGAFLPPIELPHRACAASRVQFHRALRVGDAIVRTSRIVDIAEKPGRKGPLVVVLIRHEVGDADGVALSEDQQILFRERAEPPALETSQGARADATWSRRFHADEVTLFRYSSLSFDAHRIHYDRPYATFVDGNPGLVVQGGLIACLLLDLLRRQAPAAEILGCDLRWIRPLFDIEPFSIRGRLRDGRTAELWAENAQGALAMEAVVTLRDEARLVSPDVDERRPLAARTPRATQKRMTATSKAAI
jgi:3-methylfumaryl-CoA hydratase